ncbi:extracellular solute-binding protein [Elstera cyanobacteriorum]|uniref:Spermidine/putrescine ABC transporter substrate-binding protein n=1 Tax=Elstera cyanobacteriorum TaxID=2022747 RepID=A0A255XUR1_9PROT|nr:extracellular solute-binding protein [Elstera cyanobacteriorum]MCK6444248.1 extracellular solute-binding protein [Elstera cyanobacteriorum]OYQ20739.1 spermidine/putrescine ABC transporter substrate-binding protein [Elstera cyanobacteriorum]GFZ82240.1 ABC transporter substrate-binding protein [Elstera cyanobacteriorum]
MTLRRLLSSVFAASALAFVAIPAEAQTLRLLTWGDYAPEALIKKFKDETGITVQVTLSNNEDMISKLRATGGAGFDLAQPSQDRITGPQTEFGFYKPLDLTKIDTSQFIPDLLEASKKNTTLDGKVYGVAHLWGTAGLVVNKAKAPDVKGWGDLCTDAYKGRVSMRLKRIALLGMAYANGDDPFAAYSDKAKYGAIIEKAGAKLAACKPNVKAYWTGSDALNNMLRSGEVVAAEGWDSSAFKLNGENPDIVFVAPTTGALGWIDTFALPAKGQADDAAYKWINFVMRPDNAAAIVDASGSFSASKGSDEKVSEKMKKPFQAFFPPAVIANIKWFPAIPAGLEEMEGKILDKIAAQ